MILITNPPFNGGLITNNLEIKGNLLLRDPTTPTYGGMLKPGSDSEKYLKLRSLADDDYGELFAEFMPRILAQDGSISIHTGDTNEAPLKDISIVGGTMFQNGMVHVRYFIQATGVGGLKTYRIKLGASLITEFQLSAEAICYNCIDLTIQNDGSWSEQKCSAGLLFGDNVGVVGLSISEITTNTKTLSLTGQLADAGDTVEVRGVFAWLSEKST